MKNSLKGIQRFEQAEESTNLKTMENIKSVGSESIQIKEK